MQSEPSYKPLVYQERQTMAISLAKGLSLRAILSSTHRCNARRKFNAWIISTTCSLKLASKTLCFDCVTFITPVIYTYLCVRNY